MQSLDLLGLQRDRRIAPTEADIRMMAFSFREFTNLLDKGKRLPEIAKPEAPLDAVSFLRQLPVWGLCMKERSLLARKWRNSPAKGSTGFAYKRFGHIFLICASGASGQEMLTKLRARLGNDQDAERTVVRAELLKITRLRMTKLLGL